MSRKTIWISVAVLIVLNVAVLVFRSRHRGWREVSDAVNAREIQNIRSGFQLKAVNSRNWQFALIQ